MFEFHISRYARDKYRFDQSIYQFTGNAILGDFNSARDFAHKINTYRDLIRFPEQAVRASDINALGLIDEILHALIAEYRTSVNPGALERVLQLLEGEFGTKAVSQILFQFTGNFPPVAVYQKDETVEGYLAGETEGYSHRVITLEELILLWLANGNPAFRPYDELFDDAAIEDQTTYLKMMDAIDRFFQQEPGFGPSQRSIIEVLRQPAKQHPDSLFSQLEYLLESFSSLLKKFNFRLLRSLDFLREENKPIFSGPGPVEMIEFQVLASEEAAEKYSKDSEWMPRLVLIAKNTYVWLDQLSKSYGREIRRLDQIPDEELARIAGWGFTGLWLIGLWERSEASKTIKHLTGNLDAVSSAYSLYDYTIASDLGGDAAYAALRDRAAAQGLRLAADMVPNHSGIYSKWVREHPDWFIYSDYPPFPSYTFSGRNLSADQGIGIYLEDHYYERTDAAVVFKRVDFNTGQVHYIYHGNDGTSMPWNDTAQLNYLNAEAREAVIQTIVNVARKFPIIRFDAAMTLAKKHIQRLWFPEPGHGGAIPSRSEHSLSKMRFDELLPVEFWRDVVDRIAVEAPDTLLLAEAFWLMEGYFVRTLGMHRVYNSAFMNMLRDEKNAEYRRVIKNTIEFDPEILKRYVNFMNNPDEETAIEQFGDGGKYFGICVLMCTLPGLPMFGHGQIEGFKEKYGMEYQRAYYDEKPNQGLVERHKREVFPLLHRRRLFADVEHFLLYDVYSGDGTVNEDVYAFSNRFGEESSLVLFHNKWGEASGTIHRTSPFAVKDQDGNAHTEQSSLGRGLGLPVDGSKYVIFKDQITGLEYIRSCAEIHDRGLRIDLGAFEYRVFLDFRMVEENEWSHYRMIMDYLDGRGVHDLETVKQEVILQPVLYPWKELVNSGFYSYYFETVANEPAESQDKSELQSQTRAKTLAVIEGIAGFLNIEIAADAVTANIVDLATESVRALPETSTQLEMAILLSWAFSHPLGLITSPDRYASQSRAWIDEWLFGKIIRDALSQFRADRYAYPLTVLLIGKDPNFWIAPSAYETLEKWLQDGETSRFLGVNRHQGVLWYDRNALILLIKWVQIIIEIAWSSPADFLADQVDTGINAGDILSEIKEASLIAGYQVNPMLNSLEDHISRHTEKTKIGEKNETD